jgi:hypothetical protein
MAEAAPVTAEDGKPLPGLRIGDLREMHGKLSATGVTNAGWLRAGRNLDFGC